jgi:hypothetical protein
LHILSEIYWDKIASCNQLRKRALRVDKRGRTSNTPLKKVPFNYAINREWYEVHKDLAKYHLALSDWLSYLAPNGWEDNDGTFADDEADNEGEI